MPPTPVTASIVTTQGVHVLTGYGNNSRDGIVVGGGTVHCVNANDAGVVGRVWTFSPSPPLVLGDYSLSSATTEAAALDFDPAQPGDVYVELRVFGDPINGKPNVATDRIILRARQASITYTPGIPIPHPYESAVGGAVTLDPAKGRGGSDAEVARAIVAFVGAGGSTNATSLQGVPLDATTVGTPSDGWVITYDSASGKYKAVAPPASVGHGSAYQIYATNSGGTAAAWTSNIRVASLSSTDIGVAPAFVVNLADFQAHPTSAIAFEADGNMHPALRGSSGDGVEVGSVSYILTLHSVNTIQCDNGLHAAFLESATSSPTSAALAGVVRLAQEDTISARLKSADNLTQADYTLLYGTHTESSAPAWVAGDKNLYGYLYGSNFTFKDSGGVVASISAAGCRFHGTLQTDIVSGALVADSSGNVTADSSPGLIAGCLLTFSGTAFTATQAKNIASIHKVTFHATNALQINVTEASDIGIPFVTTEWGSSTLNGAEIRVAKTGSKQYTIWCFLSGSSFDLYSAIASSDAISFGLFQSGAGSVNET